MGGRRTDVDDEQPPRDAVALAERAQRQAARELQRADRVDQQGTVAYGFAVTFGRALVLLTALLDRVLDRRDAAPREDRAMPARARRSGGAGPGSDEALARPPLGGRRIPRTSRANTRDAGKRTPAASRACCRRSGRSGAARARRPSRSSTAAGRRASLGPKPRRLRGATSRRKMMTHLAGAEQRGEAAARPGGLRPAPRPACAPGRPRRRRDDDVRRAMGGPMLYER